MTSQNIEKLARFGYFTNGVVYGLIGLLALLAALGIGGKITDNQGVLSTIGEQPFGKFLLIALGVGLAGYALWKLLQAAFNPEREKPWSRVGSGVSGVIHGLLAMTAFRVASGTGGGSQGSGFFSGDFGQFLMIVAGIALIGAGIHQVISGYQCKFLRKLKGASMSAKQRDWVYKLGRAGHIARGVVFAIIGFSFLVGERKGIDGALGDIASATLGQVLLGLVAAGLLAYGLFRMLSARFRHIPAGSAVARSPLRRVA